MGAGEGDGDWTVPEIAVEELATVRDLGAQVVDDTALALDVDIQRAVLPFEAPERHHEMDGQAVESAAAEPITMSGILEMPPSDPLPFVEPPKRGAEPERRAAASTVAAPTTMSGTVEAPAGDPLPFSEPPERSAEPERRAGASTVAAPNTMSGIVEAPASDPLPFTAPSDVAGDAPFLTRPTAGAGEEADSASVWSRRREPSTVDPAELPSALGPPSIAPAERAPARRGGRALLWLGVVVALALVGGFLLVFEF